MGRTSNYGHGLYKQLEEVMARLDCVEKSSAQEISRLNDRINTLEQENTALKKENQLLLNDNARLKSIINHDSSNTSKPPSTDQKGGKPANTFNGREKTGRKAGGQPGHKGTTLTKSEVEDKIQSQRCRHEIKNIGNTANKKYIKKYVIDLDVEMLITEIRIYADAKGDFQIPREYRSDVTYGANIKAMAAVLYSEGVMANDRIADFINAISNGDLGLSAGSVYGFCKDLENKAQTSIVHLEDELLNQEVVSTDATNVTVNGKQNYVRNFSIKETVLYRAMKSKSIKAMEKLRFLENYTGILSHDHEEALYHFGTDHAECNVHIMRYLRKNTQETEHTWSDEMISLLSEMNKARKAYIKEGNKNFQKEMIDTYERRYQELLKKGRKENKKTQHKYAKEDELALINRMEKYSHNHLLFLYNFEVPFENNMSERDLRKVKNRQKMAGGFRKDSGHEMYCAILTVVETLKRRKMAILENIRNLFIGTPAIF